MPRPNFLKSSLEQLSVVTEKTHNKEILPIAQSIWEKHLRPENPLWNFVTAKPFYIETAKGSAHVIAMIDKRLPDFGLVGFFGCTNTDIGSEVLRKACQWLKEKQSMRDVYGPINGTITRDYRFNLNDDYKVPGEPVNPIWYVDAFRKAGFKVYNRYVTGIAKHYQLFIKFITLRKPAVEFKKLTLRRFDIADQMKDLRIYHQLMNDIFPDNSIYCPVLAWEERVYNLTDGKPIFNPDYSFFLEDKGKAIGFIVAYPYQKNLIVKTIGLLPEYRNKNLSGILIKKVHDQAEKDGLKAAIYSTIRVGNAVYKMKRPGVRVFRKYITMHKSL